MLQKFCLFQIQLLRIFYSCSTLKRTLFVQRTYIILNNIFKLLKILQVFRLFQLNLVKFLFKYTANILPSFFDIFPGEASNGFSQIFFQGGPKKVKFGFYPLNLKKQSFLLIISKSRGGQGPPCPSFRRPCIYDHWTGSKFQKFFIMNIR